MYVYCDKGVSSFQTEVYNFHYRRGKSYFIEAYFFYNIAVSLFWLKCISLAMKAYPLSDQEYLFNNTEVEPFLIEVFILFLWSRIHFSYQSVPH